MGEYKPRYWNNRGRFQKEYEKLKNLIPPTGESNYEHGELLRVVTKFYYDEFNNGSCNIELPHFRILASYLKERTELLAPTAKKIGVSNFVGKLDSFLIGRADPRSMDQIVDVVLAYATQADKIRTRFQNVLNATNRLTELSEELVENGEVTTELKEEFKENADKLLVAITNL